MDGEDGKSKHKPTTTAGTGTTAGTATTTTVNTKNSYQRANAVTLNTGIASEPT